MSGDERSNSDSSLTEEINQEEGILPYTFDPIIPTNCKSG